MLVDSERKVEVKPTLSPKSKGLLQPKSIRIIHVRNYSHITKSDLLDRIDNLNNRKFSLESYIINRLPSSPLLPSLRNRLANVVSQISSLRSQIDLAKAYDLALSKVDMYVSNPTVYITLQDFKFLSYIGLAFKEVELNDDEALSLSPIPFIPLLRARRLYTTTSRNLPPVVSSKRLANSALLKKGVGEKPFAHNSLRSEDLKDLMGANLGASTVMTVNTIANADYKDMYKVVAFSNFKEGKNNRKTQSFHNGYFVV